MSIKIVLTIAMLSIALAGVSPVLAQQPAFPNIVDPLNPAILQGNGHTSVGNLELTMTNNVVGSLTAPTITTTNQLPDSVSDLCGEYQMGGAIQGRSLDLSSTVSTLAGIAGAYGFTDGPGSAARFWGPGGIATDGTNLYVLDYMNSTIRQIVIATNQVTTLAGTAGVRGSNDGTGSAARFWGPAGITTDGTNLYVTDGANHTIRKIVLATGQVTTLAGTARMHGSTDGTGSTARFNNPWGITTDGTNLYVADNGNGTVRQIVIATGEVTTLAGNAARRGSTDGTGSTARFNSPWGIDTDGTNLYVTDNDSGTVRQIVIATGQVTTLAGAGGLRGSNDGTRAAARFSGPQGIATDGTNIYVADDGNGTIRQIVIATGQVTTLAGLAGQFGSADGTGLTARFSDPVGMATDGINLYLSDFGNDTIRKIVIATGQVTTLVGVAGVRGANDGTGSGARFSDPEGITTDGTNLYVADSANNTIRKIVIASGQVTTLAGAAGVQGSTDGIGSAARFHFPDDITTDGTNLYVTDNGNSTIRKIVIATGQVTTLAGAAGVQGSRDGTGSAARLNFPEGITTDGTNLYVADTANNTIRKIVIATGRVTTLAGAAGVRGFADGTGSKASFYGPWGITTDGTNLYVADTNSIYTIRRVVIATGQVTTLAGAAGVQGSNDGTGPAARFYKPTGITTDGTNLYVADTANNTIRKIVIATGQVTTLAGAAGEQGCNDGTGSTARFYGPWGITTDGSSLFVAETDDTIRKIH